MRVFKRPDGTVRGLAVIAGLQFLAGVVVPLALREPLRPAALASIVMCAALVPLDEPERRSRPWRQQLCSVYGVVALAAFVGWLLVVTRIVVPAR